MQKPDQSRIRDLCWTVGTAFPPAFTSDRISFLPVTPRQGFLHWNVRRESVLGFEISNARSLSGGRFVVRVHDVTDIIFDGTNAHRWFDIDVPGISGNYYLNIDRTERNLLAEAGFRMPDGEFVRFARSAPVFFDREKQAGRSDAGGLLVSRDFSVIGAVENVFHARVYEDLVRARIASPGPLSVAVVLLDAAVNAGPERASLDCVNALAARWREWGDAVTVFAPQPRDHALPFADGLLAKVGALSTSLAAQIVAEHARSPFDIVNCHDWYSWLTGSAVAAQIKVPVVLTLHSTEYDRAGTHPTSRLSRTIRAWEQDAVKGADLVIAPHASIRDRVIQFYGASEEKVIIIPHGAFTSGQQKEIDAGARSRFNLPADRPVIAFIGEVSPAAGADLLVDALLQVFREHHDPICVLAGEGPLKGELEGRAWQGGIGERCRFVGHLSAHDCELLLGVARFLVIPARAWQDEGIARRALELGRPVLTTHQSRIGCVVHGQNGLLAYDNKGSIMWGVREMLGNPLGSGMLRLAAEGTPDSARSIPRAAVTYLTHFAQLRARQGVAVHA